MPGRVALTVLCVYEAVAIWTPGVPTVTQLVWRSRHGPLDWLVLCAVVAFASWLLWHLALEGRFVTPVLQETPADTP